MNDGPRPTDARRRILVVDDDEDVAAALRMLLRAEGYAVSVALSPDAAIATVRDQPPDVVLADFRLGVAMDSGIDVVRAVRSVMETSPPAVVMSADTSGAVVEAVATVRDVEFLPKPFGAEELAAAIARAFARVDAKRDG
jgi:CheY-like chemotaxis protein